MLGGFIGQFLPLTGGSLGGALNLGGNDLDFVGNVKDASGNVRVQLINTGSNRALNFNDDAGTTWMTVDENGVTIESLVLAPGNGANLDGVAVLVGDGSGNVTLSGATFIVYPGTSASSGTVFGVEFLPTVTASGSATAIGTVIGGTVSGSTSGKLYIASVRGGATDKAFFDTHGNFIKSGFTAAQAIYVDGTNGDDTNGNGTDVGPFKTISHALSVASSGQCVFVGPGNYNVTQVVCPNGVSLIGAGMDVTTLTCTGVAGQGPCVIVGTGTVVSDMTINAANGHNIPPVGFQVAAASGSTQFSSLFYLRRLRCSGDIDGFYIGNKTGTGPYTAVYFECRDCIFTSNYDTFQVAAADSTSWPVTGDLINCQFLPTKKTGGSTTLRCVTGACSLRLFNCLLTLTDTISTTTSGWATYAGISAGGFFATTVQVYGCTINFNIPNVSGITAANYNSIAMAGAAGTSNIVTIGGGNSFDPNLLGCSTATVIYLPTPSGKGVNTLAVASSAVTPYADQNGNQFEVAVDAGTLSSNTLTINNPGTAAGIGTATTTDGMETRYRINNTNSGSTAMTIALGTAFNLGGATLGTIAAAGVGYLTFAFNAASSKWDLLSGGSSSGGSFVPLAGGSPTGPITSSSSIVGGVTTLTASGSTFSTNASLANLFRLTLGNGSNTLSAPTSPTDGQILFYEIHQPSSGSAGTISWNAAFDFGTSGAPTLASTSSKVDLISFVYSAGLSKWISLLPHSSSY